MLPKPYDPSAMHNVDASRALFPSRRLTVAPESGACEDTSVTWPAIPVWNAGGLMTVTDFVLTEELFTKTVNPFPFPGVTSVLSPGGAVAVPDAPFLPGNAHV